MVLLQWSDDLETGIELIDKQHQGLFKELNAYRIKIEFRQRKKASKNLASFFENFIDSHFQTEEAFQRDINYPKAESHAAKHDIIRIRFKKIQTDLVDSDYSEESLEQFDEFIATYLLEHIQGADTIFCKYMRDANKNK